MKTSTTKNTHSVKSINLRGIYTAFAFFIFLFAAQKASAANYVVTRIDDRNNATCAAGAYIITAFGKRYTFSQPSQVLNISSDLTDTNFIGNSTFFSKQEK